MPIVTRNVVLNERRREKGEEKEGKDKEERKINECIA